MDSGALKPTLQQLPADHPVEIAVGYYGAQARLAGTRDQDVGRPAGAGARLATGTGGYPVPGDLTAPGVNDPTPPSGFSPEGNGNSSGTFTFTPRSATSFK